MLAKLKIVLICLAVAIVASGVTTGWFIWQRSAQESSKQIVSDQQSTSQEESPEQTSSDQSGGTEEVSEEELAKQDRSKETSGPYYHQVYSATSEDGLTWEKQGKMLFDHASVPGAVIKDGVIYLYFVDASGDNDQLSVGISKDLGKTFEKKSSKIEGSKSIDSVDPHPELLDNGTIRLYFLGDFTQVPQMEQKGQKISFYSADSTDGINFARPQVAYQDETIITDPDVFKTDQDWRLFASKGKGLDLAISTDGGLTFKKEPSLTWSKGGVSDTFNFNGTYRTYVCSQGIESATGANTGKLTMEQGTRIEEQGKITCDPSVIQLPDKTYLMFYKTQAMPSQQNQPGSQSGPNQMPPLENQPDIQNKPME